MKKPPCKGCEERHPGCHSECEGYIEWKKAHEATKERMRADGEAWRAYFAARKSHLPKKEQEKNRKK